MANVQILSGSFKKQKASYVAGSLVLITPDNGSKTYLVAKSLRTINKISESKGDIVFEAELGDGSKFVAEAKTKVFHELTKVADGRITSVSLKVLTPEQKKKQDRIAVWAIIIIGCIVVYGCVSREPSPPAQPHIATVEELKSYAWVYCQRLVKASLKAPDSADFPWEMGVTNTGSRYQVNSYVEAINSFNAKLRTRYTCTLQHDGDDGSSGWTVVDFNLGD